MDTEVWLKYPLAKLLNKESQPMEEKQRENTAYYGIFTNALKIQHTSK